MNGSTCVDIINGYNCTCAARFTGDRCETGTFENISYVIAYISEYVRVRVVPLRLHSSVIVIRILRAEK